MNAAYIVDAVRTPTGKGKPSGALASLHPVDLHAHALRALIQRTGIDPQIVDDVISGTVAQVGEQAANTSRFALLAAGLPESVPGVTVDRQCGSSQQAVHFAAQGVISGAYDVAIASGAESMSRVPMGSQTLGADVGGAGYRERYSSPISISQGMCAELIADQWKLSRHDLDTFATRSHTLAATAWDNGLFDSQVSALSTLTRDEAIRPGTSVDSLAGLRPAFRTDELAEHFPDLEWRVTAGNSSPLSDGSSAVLIAGHEALTRYGLTPRARFHTFAVTGSDPQMMLTGIIPATRKILAKSGMTIDDIDLFEINEAFASVVLAWQRQFDADIDRININGGAIALGHALGNSGTRVLTTLVNNLEQRDLRFGLQLTCEAGGLANATLIERL